MVVVMYILSALCVLPITLGIIDSWFWIFFDVRPTGIHWTETKFTMSFMFLGLSLFFLTLAGFNKKGTK